MTKINLVIKLVVLVATTFGLACSPLAESSANNRDVDLIEAEVINQINTFTSGTSPGVAIGINQNNKTIFRHYSGLANLETSTKVSAKSKFYLASVGKQFTAATIMQLVQEEKVSLSDEISIHLPSIPDMYASITIEQLLHHTSGIREYTSLLLFRGDDANNQDKMSFDDAYELIMSQQQLDFVPGTEYRYSSSGYVLLAKIIEEIEKKPLAEVLEQRIFKPLAMTDTMVDAFHAAIIPNRVISYKSRRGSWITWLKHFDVYGDGGVVSTIDDMSRWANELLTASTFGKNWQKLMFKKGRLNDGTTIDYAGGLQHGVIAGVPILWHGGGMGGFIADFILMPSLNMSVVYLANRNDEIAYKAFEIAEHIINVNTNYFNSKAVQTDVDSNTALKLDFDFSPWQGSYFIYERNDRRYLGTDSNGSPAILNSGGSVRATLNYIGNKAFVIANSDVKIELFTDNVGRHAYRLIAPTYTYVARQYDDTSPESLSELAHWTGDYCSQELETVVRLFIDDGKLYYKHIQTEAKQIFPVPEHSLVNWNGKSNVWVGVGMFKLGRNEKTQSKYIDVGDFRVSSVRFESCKVNI